VPPRLLAETLRATRYDPALLQPEAEPSLSFTGRSLEDLLRGAQMDASSAGERFDAAAAERAAHVCVAGVAGGALATGPGAAQARREHAEVLAGLPKRAVAAAADAVAALLRRVRDQAYPEDGAAGGASAGGRLGAGAGVVELWLAEYTDALARCHKGYAEGRLCLASATSRGLTKSIKFIFIGFGTVGAADGR
jgi:hypothetical protein